MRIAIIGGGLTGLTAAFRLSQKGHQVIIFEKEKNCGGLAGGFKAKDWSWPLEVFYHHLFPSDKKVKKLLEELGLSQRLFFTNPKTSIYQKGQITRFDSPFSLMKFPFLSFPQKIRTGLATIYLKFTNNWQGIEKIKATSWLKKFYGKKAYQVLWEPLLKAKFVEFYNQIPASWFWARIKKRSPQLGYLEGSFQILINELVKRIKNNKGQIFLNQEIKNFNELTQKGHFDRIILTTPTEIFLKIMKDQLPQSYQQKLKSLEMIGTLNLLFSLKNSFLKEGTYWLNVNETGFPFVAVVEHTNFIDKSYYGGHHILYVGGYYPQNHRYFKMKKEEILKEWLPFLKKIDPQFKKASIADFQLFAHLYTQPIVPLNYSKIIPPFKTPVKNVFLACMQQVYPWDRGINYAIEEGEKIADEIENS